MDRPLWRIGLHVLFLGFAAQRAAAAAVLHYRGGNDDSWLVAGLLLQATAGVIASLAMWLGRHMVGSLVLVGTSIVIIAVLGGFVLGGIAPVLALSEILMSVVCLGGLGYFMRHEPERD